MASLSLKHITKKYPNGAVSQGYNSLLSFSIRITQIYSQEPLLSTVFLLNKFRLKKIKKLSLKNKTLLLQKPEKRNGTFQSQRVML